MTWVVRVSDDETCNIFTEKKFESWEKAKEYIEKAVKVLEKRGYHAEKESNEFYVMVSNKNPLLRINILAFEIIE